MTLSGWPLWWRLLLISALWGSGFPLVRYLAGEMPPFALACARGSMAATGMLVWVIASGALRGYRPAMLGHALVLGTTNGWLPNVMTATALGSIPSAQAALIQSASPLFIGVLAALLLPRERPGLAAVAGLLTGFAGIALIIGPAALAPGADLAGGLLMLATAASYAIGTVYTRIMMPGVAAQLALGQQTVSALGAGTLMWTVEGGAAGLAQPWSIWLVLLATGVLASAVPVTMFTGLIQRARATDAAMVGYLQPVFAALLAALALAEWPEPRILLGGSVVLLGVWLTTRPGSPTG
ncbi:DMT family transporter [Roseomonas sp. OT10]|uniref:DMT family transporter n=1 Tax=Roseomonas cutis TaxID=2897332 RepID=UPI001E2A8A69|nr:DMT family transporter [Roseomonas sp. OT10]UFN47282.1 DMT family transporter [Roseomonas sp. OT10]